jgi:PAS domain S-box-containing protein
MSDTLEILLLEDSPADAELISEKIRKEGVKFNMRTVDSNDAFEKALQKLKPDIILSDYHIPKFDGPVALAIVKEKYPEIPFIFVTGAIGEEEAVETLRAGAVDFVLKRNLARLAPAILRAVKESIVSRERRSLFHTLKDKEERYNSLIENLPVGVFRSTMTKPGRFLHVNKALARIHEVDSVEEMMTMPLEYLYADPEDRTLLLADIKGTGFVGGRNIRYKTKSGRTIWGSITARGHRNAKGELDWLDGILEDVTEKIEVEKEREKILQRQNGINLLQRSLLVPAPLDKKLKIITDSIVDLFDADFCRIWLIRPGDLCARECIHASVLEGPHVCRFRDRCLHLISSSGRYTHTNGEGHRRVPFGCYKIGLIASGKEHKFVTNDVESDPRVHNHEWAHELGLVSFAGYQLRVPEGETIGVLAVFARHPVLHAEDMMMDGLSNTIALVVQQAEVQEALVRASDEWKRTFDAVPDLIALIDSHHRIVRVNKAMADRLKCSSEQLTGSLCHQAVHDSSAPPDFCPHSRLLASRKQEFAEVVEDRLGGIFDVSTTPQFDADGKLVGSVHVARDITDRKRVEMELRRTNEELDLLVNSIGSIIIGVSIKDRITHWNPVAEEMIGIKSGDIVGRRLVGCSIDWDWRRIYEAISSSVSEDRTVRLDDVKYRRRDGKEGLLGLSINPLKRGGEVLVGFIILGRDLTEQRKLETQLLQARKLEAIGQLAAGVAHEINSPMQYVGDNLKFMTRALHDIINLQKSFVSQMDSASSGNDYREVAVSLLERMKAIDLEYLMQELPRAAEQSLDGVTRVSRIVQSMKAFAHPGTGSKLPANINKSIESTATVSRNEWKYDCDLSLELDPALPDVPCFEAELNQVVLNLIVNAVDAIRDVKATKAEFQGAIKIRTGVEDGYAIISIADNGTGIPGVIREKIFDPFFTTKEVGKGTGQGLAISHSIIVDKHGGSLDFESETGKGTVFIIKLPLAAD